jgi:hypothetical protein
MTVWPSRAWDWFAQWADAVDATETSLLEQRVRRLELAVEQLQRDASRASMRPSGEEV